MTEKRTRQRGFLTNQQGLEILEARRQAKGYTYAELSEVAGLNSEDQVKRLFNPHWGYRIQRDAIEKIAKALELQPSDFIEDWLPIARTYRQKSHQMSATPINWREVCIVMLAQQQKDQRIRRKATERGFEVKIHVPLGLVERKQQQRRAGMISSEQVYDLDREVITRIYQHDEFLETVIGKNPQGKNRHIAIVGEPGAGKTTLLDRIATYIQMQTKAMPICILLADLQGKKLKDYLLENWLTEAIELVYPDLDVGMSQRESLQKWLRKGGVWLLLDGVDEMGSVGSSRLQEIRHQLTAELDRVRVVLTCRSNVWDAQLNNPLTGFDTYKTQDFQREDIDRFVQQWFTQAEDELKGEALQQKLKEPQRDRLSKMVKNPLRLSLLCQIFYRNDRAELPETKADLYQLFVRYFYEWKLTPGIDWTTQPGLQNELHQALGRLSIAGLDSSYRFRLPLSLIQQEMDDRLFKLAWELGWLNLVDRDAETDEPVYAFFHPTFQEYFAALAIDDWHFFLHHVPENPDEGTYRVFESQWEEVILLCICISTLSQDENLSNHFSKESLKFKKTYDIFYKFRLDLLVLDSMIKSINDSTLIIKLPNLLYFRSKQLSKKTLGISSSTFLISLAFLELKNAIKNNDIDKINNEVYTLSRYFTENFIYEFKENEVTIFHELLKMFSDENDSDSIDLILKILGCSVPGNFLVFDALCWSIFLDRGCYGDKKYDIEQQKVLTLQKIIQGEQIPLLVKKVRKYLNKENSTNSCLNEILWVCSNRMNYPDFYRAWHNTETINPSATTQHLNLSELPTFLRAELANDRELYEKIHLICIDASQFSDRDNPAADIYIEMVEQNCPQCQNGTPTTLQQLKTYWRLDLKTLEKQPVLVLYSSNIDCEFSEIFLTTLKTFGGVIVIISDQSSDNLDFLSPVLPHLIDAILKWLWRVILEA